MSNFIIKEIYIDNFNNTHNKLENFETGLNIICGDNEIGKSTMMSFIKSLFLREKIDGTGYIKCLNGEDEVNLTINNIKDNEKYINKITAHTYKTGFIITLDDLMILNKKDSDKLIDIIKDSSGDSVNNKQKQYIEFIYGKNGKNGFITPAKKPAINLKQLFNNLKEMDKKIEELEAKEKEYNDCCENLKKLEEYLSKKELEFECAKLSNETINIKKEIDKIDINKNLLDRKDEHEELKQSYGILKSKKTEENKIKTQKEDLKKEYNAILKKLSKIANYDFEKIKNFDTNTEKLKQAKKIIDDKKELEIQTDKINDKINKIKDDKKTKQKNIDKLNKKIVDLKIDDLDNYKNDKVLIENYLSMYTEEYEKIKSSSKTIDTSNNTVFLLTFSGLLMLGLALLILTNGISRLVSLPIIFASLGGVLNVILNKKQKESFEKNISLKNFNYIAANIQKLLKKYQTETNINDIVVKTNSLIQKMNYNLSEYKSLSNDLYDENSDLENYNNQLLEFEKEKEHIVKKQQEINNISYEFLDGTLLENIEDYPDLHDLVKDLQINISETEKLSQKENDIQIETEQFIQKLNKFIDDSNIDIEKTNEFDYSNYQNILKEIGTLSDNNLKRSQTKADKEKEIQEKINIINEKYSDLKDKFINIQDEILNKLNEELETAKESKTTTLLLKSQLENVEGLYVIKQNRNIELNNIRKQINDLIVKEIVLNIIQSSKETFNELQPNLINAKKYLSEITNQKYDEIDFENNIIYGKNIPQKKWDELSRGTKEQLYLSLRLGYATNYSKNNDGSDNGIPNLPMLIDDAFVNFDKNRTVAILKCLEKFSKTNQVIYFTCHTKYMEELLKSNKIKHNLIKL